MKYPIFEEFEKTPVKVGHTIVELIKVVEVINKQCVDTNEYDVNVSKLNKVRNRSKE
jgi:hypothetical protein